jgi:pyridoxamine-phosphate oxidase
MKKETDPYQSKKILSTLRRNYSLNFDLEIKDSPFDTFSIWFEAAQKSNIQEPNAMALATATRNGIPSVRMLLLKDYCPTGFIFFSSYESQKGKELEENPNASILFYWDSLERQIRISGTVKKISKEDSDAYFKTRPKGSQIAASISKQSSILDSRQELEEEYKALLQNSSKIIRPKTWGGYILIPDKFEFWQGAEDRLHHRIAYTKCNSTSNWLKFKLHP